MISVIAVNWWAEDFTKILCKSVLDKAKNEVEIIIVDNSGELKEIENVKIFKPKSNLGHGLGLDAGIEIAQGEYILILDIDAHILLQDWDEKLLKINQELACASDGGLLKPIRPLAMFFKKETIKDISFQAVNYGGVKFDVGIHAYFRILTLFGDKSIFKFPYKKAELEDVLGTEYTLNGERFIYHNWYGTRWYNINGDRAHESIDGIKYEDFKRKKDNLFKQL